MNYKSGFLCSKIVEKARIFPHHCMYVHTKSFLSEMPQIPSGSAMTFEMCEEMMPRLAEEHSVVTALTFFDNKAWIRLSANVYNTKMDYVKLRDRLAKALNLYSDQ